MRWMIICVSVLFLSACHITDKPKTTMDVNMYNSTGDKLGTANLAEDPDGVKVKLKLEGVTPGYHGLHIHEKAKCDPPDFRSAGNHFNPDNKQHGLLNPKGAHAGDLKNVKADKDGKIDTTITVEKATLLKGKKSLTEHGGTSLIVTSEADDGMSQVSGDAGDRMICGIIKREEKGSD